MGMMIDRIGGVGIWDTMDVSRPVQAESKCPGPSIDSFGIKIAWLAAVWRVILILKPGGSPSIPLLERLKMPQANPFDPPQPLDSNPFADPSGRSNPFQHPNDSAISLDSGPRQQPAGQRSQRSVDLERREREVQAAEERIRRERAEIDAQANNWPPCQLCYIG